MTLSTGTLKKKKIERSAKEDGGIKERKLGSNAFDKFQIKPFFINRFYD